MSNDLGFTAEAAQDVVRALLVRLKDRFVTLVIAIGTKTMHWFGAAAVFLQLVGKRSGIDLCELIFLLLSVPVFQLSHFCFKLTYALQQRRLRLLGAECARLGGEDFSLKFDNLRLNQRSI